MVWGRLEGGIDGNVRLLVVWDGFDGGIDGNVRLLVV